MEEYCEEHKDFPFAKSSGQKPLEGITVIDIGNLVAAPFATNLLGDFGAEVIKVEHPEYGDGLRDLEPHKDEIPLWWKVTNRNKQTVTLNLSTEEGKEVFKDLIREADVVAENFRPGTLEQWGIGPNELLNVNPELILLRVSGFGQSGPYRNRPGFGRIANAMSGMNHLIGESDGPPMIPGYPLGDGISGIFGAFSVMMALYHRDVGGGDGQVIDLALYESLFRLLEFNAIEYDQLQKIRNRNGNRHPYVAPSSTYLTKDGVYVSMTASTESIWRRLCRAMDQEGLLDNPKFESMESRVEHSDEINGIVESWMENHDLEEISQRFDDYDVGYSAVYDIQDIFNDPQFRERSLVRVSDDQLGEAVVQNVVPRLSETPGEITHLGPEIGEHNEEIYQDYLGYPDKMLDDLRDKNII